VTQQKNPAAIALKKYRADSITSEGHRAHGVKEAASMKKLTSKLGRPLLNLPERLTLIDYAIARKAAA
jgi:hypothetical protein